MKVFILGGYGKTGIPVVQALAQTDLVTQIAVAGRNLERAQETAANFGPKAVAVQVDGNDENQLALQCAGYDILANAAYNETVPSAIRAAVRTQTHYCDVSWGDAIEPALKLSPEAEAAGITAVITTGISPCISNLMGVQVARQLDETKQLQIGRADIFDFATGLELTPQDWLKPPQDSLTALLAFRPFFDWMLKDQHANGLQTALYYQDGDWVALDPLKIGLEVPRLPNGKFTLHPFVSVVDYWGMLPQDLSTHPSVMICFGQFPAQLQEVLRTQVLRMLAGGTDPETALTAFFDTAKSDPARWLVHQQAYDPISKMWVRAVGSKDGRPARCTSWFTAPMWDVGGYHLTSIALAAAVRKILRAEVRTRGVLTAEKAFEPQAYFAEVAALLPTPLPAADMIHTSFEWLA